MQRNGINHGLAQDGQEAVDKWRSGGYHLVIMDIQLPIKTGLEATREIRELERQHNIAAFASTPSSEVAPSPSVAAVTAERQTITSSTGLPVIIVAVTASSAESDRVAMLTAGCNDFITKPLSLKWLQQKLLEWGSMQMLAAFTSATSPASTTSRSASISSVVGGTKSTSTIRHDPSGTRAFVAESDAHGRSIAAKLHMPAVRPHAAAVVVAPTAVQAVVDEGERILDVSARRSSDQSVQQVRRLSHRAQADTLTGSVGSRFVISHRARLSKTLPSPRSLDT